MRVAFVTDTHAAVAAGDALPVDIAEDRAAAGIHAPVALFVRIEHPEGAGVGEIVVGEDVVHDITQGLSLVS